MGGGGREREREREEKEQHPKDAFKGNDKIKEGILCSSLLLNFIILSLYFLLFVDW